MGAAVASNPIAVVLPCHRVLPKGVGDNGEYAWGVWRKQWLLRHEGVLTYNLTPIT
ncbi:MGMT family protein [Candidatus Peregrinibacteria bacterium]|nr:MGMT family protein [Candidatus Peregrinibacteria bacterium]